MTYGFIGTGNMGGALARAAAKTVENRRCIVLANRTPEKAARLADELGASVLRLGQIDDLSPADQPLVHYVLTVSNALNV